MGIINTNFVNYQKKQNERAFKLAETKKLKKQVLAFLRKTPGIEKAAEYFNIDPKKIYGWLATKKFKK